MMVLICAFLDSITDNTFHTSSSHKLTGCLLNVFLSDSSVSECSILASLLPKAFL